MTVISPIMMNTAWLAFLPHMGMLICVSFYACKPINTVHTGASSYKEYGHGLWEKTYLPGVCMRFTLPKGTWREGACFNAPRPCSTSWNSIHGAGSALTLATSDAAAHVAATSSGTSNPTAASTVSSTDSSWSPLISDIPATKTY